MRRGEARTVARETTDRQGFQLETVTQMLKDEESILSHPFDAFVYVLSRN